MAPPHNGNTRVQTWAMYGWSRMSASCPFSTNSLTASSAEVRVAQNAKNAAIAMNFIFKLPRTSWTSCRPAESHRDFLITHNCDKKIPTLDEALKNILGNPWKSPKPPRRPISYQIKSPTQQWKIKCNLREVWGIREWWHRWHIGSGCLKFA